jgi:hypothetical protein
VFLHFHTIKRAYRGINQCFLNGKRKLSNGRKNFLEEFRLVESPGFELTLEQLYYSYFIVWQSNILNTTIQIDPGKDYPPMVKTVKGIKQVVGPGKGSVSLPDHLRKYKESKKPGEKAIFDSVINDDFLNDKKNILNKFKLAESSAFDLPPEQLCHSYFIVAFRQSHSLTSKSQLNTGDRELDAGFTFYALCFTKNIERMFNKGKNCYFDDRTAWYNDHMYDILELKRDTFPSMPGIVDKIKNIRHKARKYYPGPWDDTYRTRLSQIKNQIKSLLELIGIAEYSPNKITGANSLLAAVNNACNDSDIRCAFDTALKNHVIELSLKALNSSILYKHKKD